MSATSSVRYAEVPVQKRQLQRRVSDTHPVLTRVLQEDGEGAVDEERVLNEWTEGWNLHSAERGRDLFRVSPLRRYRMTLLLRRYRGQAEPS